LYSRRPDVNNSKNGSLAVTTMLGKIICKNIIKSAHV
jgi:hypothetical protein